jgi:hypothetical protein
MGVVTYRLPDDIIAASNRMASPPIAQAVLDTSPRDGVDRPGWIHVTFNEFSNLAAGTIRTIRLPEYLNAGHMVALTQAVDFREDVRIFLEESGAYQHR